MPIEFGVVLGLIAVVVVFYVINAALRSGLSNDFEIKVRMPRPPPPPPMCLPRFDDVLATTSHMFVEGSSYFPKAPPGGSGESPKVTVNITPPPMAPDAYAAQAKQITKLIDQAVGPKKFTDIENTDINPDSPLVRFYMGEPPLSEDHAPIKHPNPYATMRDGMWVCISCGVYWNDQLSKHKPDCLAMPGRPGI